METHDERNKYHEIMLLHGAWRCSVLSAFMSFSSSERVSYLVLFSLKFLHQCFLLVFFTFFLLTLRIVSFFTPPSLPPLPRLFGCL